jgi:ADP-heptose:LPS heptosyltransferase
VEKIALIRPGAIGDIMMALNFVQELKRKKEVTFFCSSGIHSILHNFIANNKIVSFRSLEQYKQEDFDKTIHLIGYPLNEGYPYKKMNRHLLEYFASEMETNFSFDQFTLTLPKFPKKIKNRNTPRYITFQNKTGWSTYKEWWGWQELINLIKEKNPNIEIYQIGGKNDPQIENTDGSFCGDSFEDNIAAQAWANTHIGLDSVFNHTTNINWLNKGKTKGIILFGSTQADASGYPHNDNISLGLSCQPCFKEDPKISRVPLGLCDNPPNQTYENPQHACMKGITPEMVFEKIKL